MVLKDNSGGYDGTFLLNKIWNNPFEQAAVPPGLLVHSEGYSFKGETIMPTHTKAERAKTKKAGRKISESVKTKKKKSKKKK